LVSCLTSMLPAFLARGDGAQASAEERPAMPAQAHGYPASSGFGSSTNPPRPGKLVLRAERLPRSWRPTRRFPSFPSKVPHGCAPRAGPAEVATSPLMSQCRMAGPGNFAPEEAKARNVDRISEVILDDVGRCAPREDRPARLPGTATGPVSGVDEVEIERAAEKGRDHVGPPWTFARSCPSNASPRLHDDGVTPV